MLNLVLVYLVIVSLLLGIWCQYEVRNFTNSTLFIRNGIIQLRVNKRVENALLLYHQMTSFDLNLLKLTIFNG